MCRGNTLGRPLVPRASSAAHLSSRMLDEGEDLTLNLQTVHCVRITTCLMCTAHIKPYESVRFSGW